MMFTASSLIIINLCDYDLVLSGIIDLNLRNFNQTAIMKCDYFHIICGKAEPLLHYLYSVGYWNLSVFSDESFSVFIHINDTPL